MLVLTRRDFEEVWIGDQIRVVVSHTTSGKCRLLIDAPAEMKILRGELKPHDQPRIERHGEPDETSPE